MNEHRVRWFARVQPCEEFPDGFIPRNSSMRGRDWGWDVKCSCGWETRTGGAIEASIKRDIEDHRWLEDPDGEEQRAAERRRKQRARWQARSKARREQLEELMK